MKKLYWLYILAASVVLVTSFALLFILVGGNETKIPLRSNDDLIREAARNMREAKSYSYKADIFQPNMSFKIKADLDLDGRKSRTDIEGSLYGSILDLQMIERSNSMYTSASDGKAWARTSRSTGSLTFLLTLTDPIAEVWTEMADDEVEEAIVHLRDGSPAIEQVDGVTTKHMTGDIMRFPAFAGIIGGHTASEGVVDVWISTDSPSYVRRMQISGKSGRENISGSIVWSRFDEVFDIPRPTGLNERP